MKVNEILKAIMKERKVTQEQMGEKLGLVGGQRVINRKLKTENWRTDSVIDFLDHFGYELVIKPKQRGKRSENEYLIEKSTKEDKE